MRRTLLFLALTASAQAQWQMQDAHTTADLRGIAALPDGAAWASGSSGTVLRTEDAGFVWQLCAIPPGAEHLDFRGIQAFDSNTAIVMSSGKGDLSRLYKTTDGCQTWKLLLTNPDPEGFWDAIVTKGDQGFLIGDPVGGRFAVFASKDTHLKTWERFGTPKPPLYARMTDRPWKSEALFTASDSVLEGEPGSYIAFVTGGEDGAFFHVSIWRMRGILGFPTTEAWTKRLPLATSASAGAFSFAGLGEQTSKQKRRYIVVGGDYLKPDSSAGTVAFSKDGGKSWNAATTPPHGYRSSVAYDPTHKIWVTVGPNGTDISTDDGRNWRALRPSASEPADADKNWNALSLPYVVGPHGRIARLRDDALKQP